MDDGGVVVGFATDTRVFFFFLSLPEYSDQFWHLSSHLSIITVKSLSPAVKELGHVTDHCVPSSAKI